MARSIKNESRANNSNPASSQPGRNTGRTHNISFEYTTKEPYLYFCSKAFSDFMNDEARGVTNSLSRFKSQIQAIRTLFPESRKSFIGRTIAVKFE